MLAKIKQFWLNNERNIVLVLGFVLVAAISFEAGLVKGKENQEKPLVIEKTVSASNQQIKGVETAKVPDQQIKSEENPSQASKLPSEASNATKETNNQGQNNSPQNCAFVGSKNSNKYHLPDCRWAKNIKPENLVCFSSAEDALAKGYQPDKNCVK